MLGAVIDGFTSRLRDETNSMAKQAKPNDLILHRIGKTKSYMVGGRGGQSFLVDKLFEQPLVKRIHSVLSKINPKGVAIGKERARSAMLSMGVGGTVTGGKSYIDRDIARSAAGSVREVVNHEAFHLKPVVGKSETLAHIAGGLRSRKGTISPTGAAKAYAHLWRTRPIRALLEHGIVGGSAYGASRPAALAGNSDRQGKSSE